MKLPKWIWLALVLAALVAGMAFSACGDDDDDDDDDGATARYAGTFITFNAGLAHGYVPYAEERVPVIEDALAGLDADALCMQEVWLDEDVEAVEAAAGAAFTNEYRYDSTADYEDLEPEPAACTEEELTDLRDCAEEYCDGLEPDEVADCVLANCAAYLPEGDCFDCLAANLGQTFDEIYDICTSEGAPSVIYDGANGVLLFSNWELSDTDVLKLDFYFIVRVVLHAVADTDAGPLHLFCTHLTADISDTVPYSGDYESYEAEQAAQIEALLNWVEEKAGDEPAVIMGDFNTGPETDGADAAFPDNYALFTDAGVDDPYVAENGDECTFCADNPLTGGAESSIIDHAFFLGFPDPLYEADRIFDDPVTITVEEQEQESRLSDHYGVLVTAQEAGPD